MQSRSKQSMETEKEEPEEGEAGVRFKAEVIAAAPPRRRGGGRVATGRPRGRPSRRAEGGGGRQVAEAGEANKAEETSCMPRSSTSRPTRFSGGDKEK